MVGQLQACERTALELTSFRAKGANGLKLKLIIVLQEVYTNVLSNE
jgi:hypothetical protein